MSSIASTPELDLNGEAQGEAPYKKMGVVWASPVK
jgi:hypothetical protein